MNNKLIQLTACGLACTSLIALFVVAQSAHAAPTSGAKIVDVIREAQQKNVKIYGAGGIRGLEAFQSGFLISAEGHVLTAFSPVLDSDTITVTLDDGRKFEGKLLGADPRLEIAVLKIEATDLPHFDLAQAATGATGTRVYTFSNLFGVATGDEPVSMLHGSIAAVTPLAARRGSYETPYQGPVYVLDAMTNNPGAAGGALTNLRGELLGMLGKQLRSSRNNTWLNFALPANEMVEAVENIKSGKVAPVTTVTEKNRPAHPLAPADFGLVLVPNVLERTPPFIDDVRPNSPAAKAGIRPDDLLVFVNKQLVQTCTTATEEFSRLDRDTELHLSLMRNGEMVEITLKTIDE